MSEASAVLDHADEVILPIIALASGYNGAVISITEDLNLYVRPGGSDANDGYTNTDAHAFSSGTRAYEEAKRFIPSDGAQIIINLGTGMLAPIQAVGYIPGPPVVFRGNGASLTSVVKGVTGAPVDAAFYADAGASILVENFKVGGNALGNGIMSSHGATVTIGTGMDLASVAGSQLLSASGGSIYNYSPYTISGGGASHMGAWGAGAYIEGGSTTVTIPAAITFTSAFVDVGMDATVFNSDTDYVGRENVTGMRFIVKDFGYINTENSGLNYFPGTIAGTWLNGGAYDQSGGANPGPPGPTGPMGPKSLSLQLPIAGDEVSMFYARAALTITQINAVVRGTTPGVTWQVLYAASRNSAGTPVITAPTNTTSLANNTITTFNNPNVPANNWVWMKVTATSGIALELGLSLQF
jgi:hypothetical protein